MTDEQMHARLRQAGENWRAVSETHTDAGDRGVEILDTGAPGRVHRPHRAALLVSAAAVAAALIAAGTVLLGGSAAKDSASTDTASLKGTVWRLVGYGEQQQPNALSTLFIGKDGSLVADDECTVIGSTASISGDQFRLTGGIDVRSRDCVDSTAPMFEGVGVNVLTGPATFAIDGNDLTLRSAGQPAMHLVAAPQLPAPSLDVPTFVGANWQLTGVTDGDGVAHQVPRGATLRLVDSRLTVSDGCNTLSGKVQVSGNEVQLDQLAGTAIGCTGSIAATAAIIDRFFSGPSVHGGVDGARLTVKGGGVGYLTYEWMPDDPATVTPSALAGREWVLTSIAGVPAKALASLGVDPRGPTSGTDGCADIDAAAEVRPGTLQLTGIPDAPSKLCTGAAAEQATTIDSVLNQKPALWAVRNGKLLIYGGGAQAFSLVYETGKPPPNFPSHAPDLSVLSGNTWTLTGIETDVGGTSSGHGTSGSGVTLNFDGKGEYRLTSHCGGQAGKVQLSAGHARFSAARAEGASYCVLPPLEDAKPVLFATVDWKIEDGELRLTKGTTTLVFDPA